MQQVNYDATHALQVQADTNRALGLGGTWPIPCVPGQNPADGYSVPSPAGTFSGQDKPVQPQDSRVIQFPTVGKYTDAVDDLDSARFAKAVAAHVSQHFPGTLHVDGELPECRVVHPDDMAVAQVAHDLGFTPPPVKQGNVFRDPPFYSAYDAEYVAPAPMAEMAPSSPERVEDKNQAVPFDFQGDPVRVMTGRDGEPWFVAKDVAEALGIVWNGMKNIQHVPDEWRLVESVSTSFGTKDTFFLSEQGLYFFLGRSNKPKALPFQRWIAGEVVPAIRKHGAYMTPQTIEDVLENPDLVIGLATKLKEERARSAELAIAKARLAEENTELAFEKQALTAENSVLKPKADMHDSLMEADGAIDMGQAAKVLCEDFPGVGRNRLFRFLRWYGVLMYDIKQKNVPTQRYMNAGYFRVVVKGGSRYGSKYVQSQTFVKPEGMKFLHNLLNKFYDGNTIRYLPNKAA